METYVNVNNEYFLNNEHIINKSIDTLINTKNNNIENNNIENNVEKNYTEKYNTIINKLFDNTLTKKMYYDPVLADDGEIYEKSALLQYLKNNNNTSPKYPNLKISKNVIRVNIIKSLVDLFKDHNPKLKDNVFVAEDTDLLDYDYLNIILSNNNFEEIRKFKEIELDTLNVKGLLNFIGSDDIDFQKYFVDHVVDLDCPISIGTHNDFLINIAICSGNYKLVEYLVGKVNVNCVQSHNNNTPLHILIRKDSSRHELIINIINSGADLTLKDSQNYSVLNYIVRFCHSNVIECVLHYCAAESDIESKSKHIDLLYGNSNVSNEDKENFVSQMFC